MFKFIKIYKLCSLIGRRVSSKCFDASAYKFQICVCVEGEQRWATSTH